MNEQDIIHEYFYEIIKVLKCIKDSIDELNKTIENSLLKLKE